MKAKGIPVVEVVHGGHEWSSKSEKEIKVATSL